MCSSDLATGDGKSFVLEADALGRRALYVALVDDVAIAATRVDPIVAALRAAGKTPTLDDGALRAFLTLSFVPAPHTPYREVIAVPAAHRASFRVGEGLGAFERFYDTPIHHGAALDDDAAMRAIGAALDVAIGDLVDGHEGAALLLSGGLDSAAIAAFLGGRRGGHRALTIDFDEGSEGDVAAAIARASGLAHERLLVTGDAAHAALDAVIAALDVPIGDPVVVPFFIAGKALAGRPPLVLNGEGGDQLFAGWATKPMLAWACYAPPDEDPTPTYLQTFHKLADVEDEALGPRMRGAPSLASAVIRPFLTGARAHRHEGFLHLLCDANLWLKGAGNILPRIDRMLSASGLDAASPLLDPRVVAASFALAPTQKQRGTTEKWVLRALLRERLPAEILALPKRGMRVPLRAWLDGPLRALVHDVLSPTRVRARGVFDEGFVARLLADDVRAPDLRRRRRDEWLWLALVTELWLTAHAP